MATLKRMREELSNAHHQGYTNRIRRISGIDGAPKDATEVFILYLALESARERDYAFEACEAVKKWAGTKWVEEQSTLERHLGIT